METRSRLSVAFALVAGLAPVVLAGIPVSHAYAGASPGSAMATDASNAVTPAARRNLGGLPAINVMTDYGAVGDGVSDDTAAIRAAYAAACAKPRGAKVYWPAGIYKLTGTVTINCNYITTSGAGNDTTLIEPTNNGDTFLCEPSSGPYLDSCNFSDLRIYRTDNPTAGAAIHWAGAQISTVTGVVVTGAFHDFQSDGSLNSFVSDSQFDGSNTAPGAAIAFFDYDSSTSKDNADLHFSNVEFEDLLHNTYANGIVIENCDGCQFSNGHIGFMAGPAIYLHPVNADDDVDNIYFTNWDVDNGTYGLLCDTEPAGFTGNLETIRYSGQFYAQSVDAVSNACANLTDVHLENTTYLNMGASAVSLSAGSHFNLQNSQFAGGNNGDTGVPMVSLSGTASAVDLSGSQFYQGISAHAVTYNLSLGGAASQIRMIGGSFADASIGDVNEGTSGSDIDIEPAHAGQSVTIGSCTNLGTGGVCALLSGSDYKRGLIQLTTGTAPAASGQFSITFPFTAPTRWSCAMLPNYGSGIWDNGATLRNNSSTTTVGGWWFNNGVALTASKTYLISYKCDAQ